jgi:hypothetical protein
VGRSMAWGLAIRRNPFYSVTYQSEFGIRNSRN